MIRNLMLHGADTEFAATNRRQRHSKALLLLRGITRDISTHVMLMCEETPIRCIEVRIDAGTE